jgi:anti-repressor protein
MKQNYGLVVLDGQLSETWEKMEPKAQDTDYAGYSKTVNDERMIDRMDNTGMKVFENMQFGQVRVVEKDGEPWFVLKDVCEAFGDSNYRRISSRLDEDEKGVSQMYTPGGNQNATIVNESGVYSVLFQMQPEKARGVSDEYVADRVSKLKKFKRWITHEVIPSIRKHGAYITPVVLEEALLNPDTLILLAQTIKNERQKRLAVEQQRDAAKFRLL